MRCALVGLLGLAACGRLGFDPVGRDGSAGDDGPLGDGRPPIDTSSTIDAAPTACDQAIAVGVGRTVPISTCSFPDRLDSCGPAGRQEVVFRFVAPITIGYTIAARNPGTSNVSNSTQLVDGATCIPIPGCAAIQGRSFSAGQIVYFVVEASTAPCTMIELEITQG